MITILLVWFGACIPFGLLLGPLLRECARGQFVQCV